MDYRIEHDSMGEVRVPSDVLWGAQTQRSFNNFKIGTEKMPKGLIAAFGALKRACAMANAELVPSKMTEIKLSAITAACEEIMGGALYEQFPLSIWQTGSGTQTNMNANEVIANYAKRNLRIPLHPNDDVNMSQSSNDTFPSAMSICAVCETEISLLPALDMLIGTLYKLERENEGIVKSGRTHLQDAVPIAFSAEISGWRYSLERDRDMIIKATDALRDLAIGATAVGSGLNAPEGFGERVAEKLTEIMGMEFRSSENKYHSLSSKDEFVFAHGALKALACDLMKMANDIRWLASGPRCGLGEIFIPENEPGSSIMPGKVNPTQCESMTMVCAQVMGNDTTVGICAASGNFELNVFMPALIHNYMQSLNLLANGMMSFDVHCVSGIVANREQMHRNLHNSLMLATALNPYIGYENAAKTVKKAHDDNISLREACTVLGFLTEEEFDKYFHPEDMA